ncbi:hypothetical protein HNO88_001802 [Novosphingobium chloroacetimidivorans]|uniref:Lipoprotein n=1 Tax=Novosphingobium chloroacetimidivorans TaxID=1428314 RepID=A0A7W7K918_9SPHN|nr:hypothetical protein [Novosphingobium chloroacetimidivorans]MBB4858479.1 hypothetical protein [Novosphingobium chloroacetimidivorans]
MTRPNTKGLSLSFLKLAPLAVISVLAACAQKVPPPPPPPVVVIPPQPQPPMGAPLNMRIPEVADDGTRKTVNTSVSTAQAVWNLRSAYNVAALNCVEPEYAPVLAGYKDFLKIHDKSLDKADADLKKNFNGAFGKSGTRERETYQTQVYNFFSVPPVKSTFCNAAMALATEMASVPAGQLEGYAPQGLAKIEAPFMAFFDAYDQYRADLAAWQAKYGGIVVVAPDQARNSTTTARPGPPAVQPQ